MHTWGRKEERSRFQGTFRATIFASVACALVCSVNVALQGQNHVVLGSLMSEFSKYAQSPDVTKFGEMKASSNFYSSEGQTPKAQAQAWTGDGGSAFKFLQSEANSPIDEAEQDRRDTLDADSRETDGSDLYGSWSGHRGREREHHDDVLQHLRHQEEARRSAQDKTFFSGVEKAFGKKTGDFLMKKFDPSAGKQRSKSKRSSRRRQPRSRSRTGTVDGTSPDSADGVLGHVGVIGSAKRMQRLFQEFKDAKSSKRKALLKGKVMALQKQIEGDFAKVTSFGKAAETALKKAEAKEKKANNKIIHKGHGHIIHIGDPL